MDLKINVLSVFIIVMNILLGLLIPVGGFLFCRKKLKTDIKPFITGMIIFLVFSFLLENIIHMFILPSGLGSFIKRNPWGIALYGGLVTAILHELIKFFVFKKSLKAYQMNDNNVFMYVAGFAGLEIFVILSISMITNLITIIKFSSGGIEALTKGFDEKTAELVISQCKQLLEAKPQEFLAGGIERIAFLLQRISFSIMVWFAAKDLKKLYLFFIAFVLHVLSYTMASGLNGIGRSIVYVELILWVFSIISCVIAFFVYKKLYEKPEIEIEFEE
jgi:uncharacterized membrane protein YhfC